MLLDLAPRRIGARTFDFTREVAVMAVVNRTPDSFHDRGATFALDAAIASATKAATDGADWVDIGGMPFSKLTAELSTQEQTERVLPVVRGLRELSDVVISVDTHDAAVAAACLDAGANVINDVTGLRDPAMVRLVAESGASVVVAHSLATSHTEHGRATYDDVVAHVREQLLRRVDAALDAGVAPEQIIIDPGHDLNKNTLHSLEITRRLSELTHLGYPVLVACSNKDFIGETLDRESAGRLPGSLAAITMCVAAGARIVRVHDVVASVDAVKMTMAVLGHRKPAYLRHNMDDNDNDNDNDNDSGGGQR